MLLSSGCVVRARVERLADLVARAFSWCISLGHIVWAGPLPELGAEMESPLAMEMPQEQEAALQRFWARRPTMTVTHADEPGLLDDFFPQEQEEAATKPQTQLAESCFCQQPATEPHDSHVEHIPEVTTFKSQEPIILDASKLGDFPARYEIPALHSHEFPVVGLWVDPRVVPGFRYRVRPLDDKRGRHLFGGRALTLQSIGRGYSRRLTFEPNPGSLNDNENYLWSDSRPQGLAFELEAISPGDKFTLQDVNHVIAGTAEIIQIQRPQKEINHKVLRNGSVQKSVQIHALCKVEWFDDGQSPVVVPVSGVVVAVRAKGAQRAVVEHVINACVGVHQRRGFTLTPGVNAQSRQITVRGEDIGDVPARYSITGLEAYEHPVIGTYVDPRITPGFFYRVRPAGSRRPLFQGRSLRLASIGMGYGKRITFAPDSDSLNSSTNFFWSDSHPDGLGFEPRAVHAGMKFAVMADGQSLGEATVFRADAAQQEVRQELVKGPKGCSVVKYIQVDVTCHVTMDSAHDGKKLDTHTMRVSGTAVVVRHAGSSIANLQRVENVGLDSHLNLLFVSQHSSLEFRPL
ncbi:Protein of unknown function [Gryllus bimaculatus]|nr:Protein of unknown function [Gryllus bimaculatus]